MITLRDAEMPTLVVLQGGEATPISLTNRDVVIGRLPECELQLDSNMVSRKHARVYLDGSTWMLEDLGSGNGTIVNGKRIEGPVSLVHEDRIKLGPVLIRFELEIPAAGDGRGTSGLRRSASSSADDPMDTIPINFASGDDDIAKIMSTSSPPGGGLAPLDVQPQAKLKAVMEISRSLAGTVNLSTILPRILDTLFSIFPHADRGCILLKHDSSGKMVPRAMKHRRAGDDETVKLSRTILNTVLTQKTGVLSADATQDARFDASESISNLTIRSMMCVPMLGLDGEPTGIINLDTQNPFNQFKPEDLDLLMVVAGQAALSYESTRLLVSYMEKQKQDSEMKIATGVQRALLPENLPTVKGWQFFASYDAAQAVGGDYYDCHVLDDGRRICLSFGDVAGKGVPASLVMSRLSSVVANTITFVPDVTDALNRINTQMCARAVEGRFVTFVLAMIDLEQNQLSVVNAGHMPLMVRHADGTVEEFGEESIGIPLGVMEDYPYEAAVRHIEPGDTLVIYTDGVSEAMNPQGDLYGVDRIRQIVLQPNLGSAEAIGRELREDVRRHASGREQNDDITLMVFGRLAENLAAVPV